MSAMPFGLKIAIINREFRKRLDEKASDMGLTAVQLRVLGSVSRLEAKGVKEIHQNDLEKIEHVTHPAMTKLIQKLENKGFIKCFASEQDKRYKKITSTDKSHDIYKVILAQDNEVVDELLSDFTQQQKAQFIEMIDAVLAKSRS